jgi:hypothetical protein
MEYKPSQERKPIAANVALPVPMAIALHIVQ